MKHIHSKINDIQLDGYPIYLFEKAITTYECNDSKLGKAIDQEITDNDNYVPTLLYRGQNIMENAIEDWEVGEWARDTPAPSKTIQLFVYKRK